MKNKLIELLNTTAGRLIFALGCGWAYYLVLFNIIVSFSKGSPLLAIYFAPAIIFGAAILIIKLMKQATENENPNAIIKLFIAHSILFVIGIITMITGIMR